MFPSRLYIYKLVKFQVNRFSQSCVTLQNYYDSLGITPKATQSDIKTAYYKLSKLYHPDKNEGSIDASKKFQDISNAYEILGNFKSRKLYDKGLLPSSISDHSNYPEHPEAKFYRSRETRSTVLNAEPIYDFDEWSKAHYGDMFQRAARAKERFEIKRARENQARLDIKSEKITVLIGLIIFLFLGFSYINEDLDHVKTKDK